MNFCYPHHYGHPAWPYYAETVEDAAIEDLFWRKMQADPTFTKKVIKAVWPDANESQHELLITPNLSVSLLPESYAAYTGLQPCGLNYLYGDQRDIERIKQGTLTPDSGGYYLGPLVAHQRGWLPKNVVHNLMQVAKEDLTASDRFYFSQKANHHQIFINELVKEEIESVIGTAYPTIFGFSQYELYWYTTEDGRLTHGTVYYRDTHGNIHKLPISAREPTYPTRRRTRVYDMLNIIKPYPLWLKQDRYVSSLLCFGMHLRSYS